MRYNGINQANHCDTHKQQTCTSPNFKHMLEYYKAVLGNVTFDTMLFRKELRKAMKQLIAGDRVRLRDWLKEAGHV